MIRVGAIRMTTVGKRLVRSQWRFLREGAEGPEVASLQARLTGLGYDVGEVDGRFGPATKDALLEFQREHGLYPDGIAGPQVLKLLDSKNVYPRILHIVESREAPLAVAGRYGVPLELLLGVNRIPEGELLREGQRVVIPTRMVVGYVPAEFIFGPRRGAGEEELWNKQTISHVLRMTMLITFGHKVALMHEGATQGQVDSHIGIDGPEIDGYGQYRHADRVKPRTLFGVQMEAGPGDLGEEAAASIVESLVPVVSKHGLMGVHLCPSRELLSSYGFLEMARSLKRSLKEEGRILTLEVGLGESPPAESSSPRPYKKLLDLVDWVVSGVSVMAFPVASLRRSIKRLLKDVPPWKVLMSIPLSSWEKSPEGSSEMISYTHVSDLISVYKPLVEWDGELGLSRFKYRSFGEIHEVFFEDSKSFTYKLELSENAKLAGIALRWLGVGDPEIFEVMKRKFVIWHP